MRKILAPLSLLLQLQLCVGTVAVGLATAKQYEHHGQHAFPKRNRGLHESFQINDSDGSIIMPPTTNSVVTPSPTTGAESSSTAAAETESAQTLPGAADTDNATPDGKQENGVCPPCPQCLTANDNNNDPLSMDYNNNATLQDPLTMQILVVDSPGIITMGTYLRSRGIAGVIKNLT